MASTTELAQRLRKEADEWDAEWVEHEFPPFLREVADRLEATPTINVKCETSDGIVHGSTYLNVTRVEREDDGSLTAVTDHWPK
jgi:hypothetical protein